VVTEESGLRGYLWVVSWYQGRRIQAGQTVVNVDGDSPRPHPHSLPLEFYHCLPALEIILMSATETNNKVMSETETQYNH